MIDEYLQGVAANLAIGLERSLDTNLDMYRYELHAELGRLQQEATKARDAGDVDAIVAIAGARKVPLDLARAETLLRELIEAERYESVEE
jgi:hypothetical protein